MKQETFHNGTETMMLHFPLIITLACGYTTTHAHSPEFSLEVCVGKTKNLPKKRFISYVVQHPNIACIQINPLTETPYIMGMKVGTTVLEALPADGRPAKHIPVRVIQKKHTQRKKHAVKLPCFCRK